MLLKSIFHMHPLQSLHGEYNIFAMSAITTSTTTIPPTTTTTPTTTITITSVTYTIIAYCENCSIFKHVAQCVEQNSVAATIRNIIVTQSAALLSWCLLNPFCIRINKSSCFLLIFLLLFFMLPLLGCVCESFFLQLCELKVGNLLVCVCVPVVVCVISLI